MPRRAQNQAWDDFVDWCRRRGLMAVPANPWTLAAYVRWCEPRHTPRAIAKMIKEISTVHESKTRRRLESDPLVQRTLKMIETQKSAAREKPRVELFEADAAKARKQSKTKKSNAAVEVKRTRPVKAGLSATPRLVSRRRLSS